MGIDSSVWVRGEVQKDAASGWLGVLTVNRSDGGTCFLCG
jgi:hypothetical protein